jgi:hypothetical protein
MGISRWKEPTYLNVSLFGENIFVLATYSDPQFAVHYLSLL